MNNEKAPLLEMKNIKKDFFGNQVLSEINITLREGDVLEHRERRVRVARTAQLCGTSRADRAF